MHVGHQTPLSTELAGDLSLEHSRVTLVWLGSLETPVHPCRYSGNSGAMRRSNADRVILQFNESGSLCRFRSTSVSRTLATMTHLGRSSFLSPAVLWPEAYNAHHVSEGKSCFASAASRAMVDWPATMDEIVDSKAASIGISPHHSSLRNVSGLYITLNFHICKTSGMQTTPKGNRSSLA